MSKKSYGRVSYTRDSEDYLGTLDEEDVVAEEVNTDYTKVKVRLRISARVKAVGPVTGKRYLWERAGAELKVGTGKDEIDVKDLAGLLEKQYGAPCCGGNSDNMKLFEIVY